MWWVISGGGLDPPFDLHHSQLSMWQIVTIIIKFFVSLTFSFYLFSSSSSFYLLVANWNFLKYPNFKKKKMQTNPLFFGTCKQTQIHSFLFHVLSLLSSRFNLHKSVSSLSLSHCHSLFLLHFLILFSLFLV